MNLFTKYTLAFLLFSFISWMASAQATFTNLNGFPGGRIVDIQIDAAGKLYAVSDLDRRIYVSADNGTSWASFGPNNADIRDFIIDGTTMYYANYASFYKSTDSGATWTLVSSNQFRNTNRIYKGTVSSTVFVIQGNCEGLYVSSDSGVTWTNITTNTSCTGGSFRTAIAPNGDVYFMDERVGILRHPFAADGVWNNSKVTTVFAKLSAGQDGDLSVAVNPAGKVFITHQNSTNSQRVIEVSATGNSGTFTPLTGPTTDFFGSGWTLSPSGKMYMTDGQVRMWELTNETTPTWTAKSYPGKDYLSQATALSFTWKSATEAYAGSDGGGVFHTTDTGTTWTAANGTVPSALLSPNGSDIEILGNGTLVALSDQGAKGVWTSADQGVTFTWRPQSFNIYGPRWQQKLIKLPDNSLIASTSSGTQRTTDGINWTQQNTSGFTYITSGTDLYGLSDGVSATRVSKSIDQGVTWAPITVNGLPANYYVMYALRSSASGNFFLALQNNSNGSTEYWKIDTSVTPWLATKLITPLSVQGNDCSGFFELNNKIYASDRQQVAISPDQGVNWTTVKYFHEQLVPIRQGTGGIGLATRGALVVTQDDGINWRSTTLPASQSFVRDLAQDAGGNFYGVCFGGPVVKLTSKLILTAAELPPPINFTWQPLGGPNGGYTNKIVKNSTNQIFAKTGGALFRNNSATASWDRVSITGHVYDLPDVIIDNANKIYALDSYQLNYSSDGGITWTRAVGGFSDARKIIKTSSGNLVITSGSGILVSTNDGATFTKPGTAASGSFGAINVTSTGTIMATKIESGVSTLLKSTDNGATWAAVTGVDLSANKEVLSISPLEAGAMAVVTTDNIYKTTDGGGTWISIKGNVTTIFNDNYNRNFSKVYISPTNEYFFSNQLSLYSSTDNGTTWTKKSDTPVFFTSLLWVSGTLYASTISDGVYQSTDNGATFTTYQNNKGLYGLPYNGLEHSASKIFTAAGGGKFYSSFDDGLTFSTVNSNVYTDFVSKLPNGNLVAYGGGIAQSTDGGTTWTTLAADPGYYRNLITPDGTTFYAIRNLNGIDEFVKSTDLLTWSVQTATGMPTNIYIQTLSADLSGTLFFTGYNNANSQSELYRVAFGNTVLVNEVVSAGSVQFSNNTIVAYSGAGNILQSTDGINWVKKSAPSNGGGLLITYNNYFFINEKATGALWLSRDQGISWQNIGGYVGDAFLKIKIDPTSGYAYAVAENRPVLKSSAIVLPNDNTPPVVTTLSPGNTTINVPLNFSVAITFDEPVKGITAKKVRLLDVANPGTPLEIWAAPAGVFSNNNKTITFQPTVAISYLKNYFVIVDNGAFTDIFGNAFAGITTNTGWNFTTHDQPDTQAPVSTFTSSNLTKGAPNTFELAVTDNKSIATTKTNIFYRGISALKSAAFQNTAMTVSSGATATSAKFTVAAAESWYDAMGLEFYFIAEDVAGNKGRLPADTAAYFYSYIDYTTSKPKIPGIAFGETETSYRIISVPHKLVDTQILTQFNELGEANKSKWRMATYNGIDYDEVPEKLKDISRGKGYWIILRSFTDVFLENAITPDNNRNSFFTINLKKGWNQIGNPYTVPISWEEIRTGNTSVGVLKQFTNGAYTNGDVIAPYEGGFVNVTQDVAIKVRFKGITTGGRKGQIGSDLAADNWELPLAIVQGERGNQIGGIGMNVNSSEGIDAYDDFNPPPFLSRVELNFKSATGSVLAKSVVPKQDQYQWSFSAVAENSQSATLKWDNTAFGNNEKELYLLDEVLQQTVNMRSQREYTFKGGSTRNFKIYFGEKLDGKIMPTLTLMGDPFPNPSNGKVAIPFTIRDVDQRTQVNIEIYNSLGQPVAVLTQGQYDPGFYKTEWVNAQANMPAGIYFCKWVSQNKEGNIVHQIKKLIIQ